MLEIITGTNQLKEFRSFFLIHFLIHLLKFSLLTLFTFKAIFFKQVFTIFFHITIFFHLIILLIMIFKIFTFYKFYELLKKSFTPVLDTIYFLLDALIICFIVPETILCSKNLKMFIDQYNECPFIRNKMDIENNKFSKSCLYYKKISGKYLQELYLCTFNSETRHLNNFCDGLFCKPSDYKSSSDFIDCSIDSSKTQEALNYFKNSTDENYKYTYLSQFSKTLIYNCYRKSKVAENSSIFSSYNKSCPDEYVFSGDLTIFYVNLVLAAISIILIRYEYNNIDKIDTINVTNSDRSGRSSQESNGGENSSVPGSGSSNSSSTLKKTGPYNSSSRSKISNNLDYSLSKDKSEIIIIGTSPKNRNEIDQNKNNNDLISTQDKANINNKNLDIDIEKNKINQNKGNISNKNKNKTIEQNSYYNKDINIPKIKNIDATYEEEEIRSRQINKRLNEMSEFMTTKKVEEEIDKSNCIHIININRGEP